LSNRASSSSSNSNGSNSNSNGSSNNGGGGGGKDNGGFQNGFGSNNGVQDIPYNSGGGNNGHQQQMEQVRDILMGVSEEERERDRAERSSPEYEEEYQDRKVSTVKVTLVNKGTTLQHSEYLKNGQAPTVVVLPTLSPFSSATPQYAGECLSPSQTPASTSSTPAYPAPPCSPSPYSQRGFPSGQGSFFSSQGLSSNSQSPSGSCTSYSSHGGGSGGDETPAYLPPPPSLPSDTPQFPSCPSDTPVFPSLPSSPYNVSDSYEYGGVGGARLASNTGLEKLYPEVPLKRARMEV
jgi:hypothetical protein